MKMKNKVKPAVIMAVCRTIMVTCGTLFRNAADTTVVTERTEDTVKYITYTDNTVVKIEEYRAERTSLADSTIRYIPCKKEYYKNGQLVKAENYRSLNGKLYNIVYYENGIKTGSENYERTEDREYIDSVIEYDTAGRITEKVYFSAEGEVLRSEKFIFGNETSRTPYMEDYYNSNGNIIFRRINSQLKKDGNNTRKYYNRDGKFLYSVNYTSEYNVDSTFIPGIDMSGSRPLKEEEVAEVNSKLTLGNYDEAHPLEYLLTDSCYGEFSEMSMYEFINGFQRYEYEGKRKLTDNDAAELEMLKKEGVDLHYETIETDGREYYCIPYSAADEFLKEYGRTELSEMRNFYEAVFSDGSKNFYANPHISGGSSFYCIGGEINDNWLKLYDEDRTWIFRRSGDEYTVFALTEENNINKDNIWLSNIIKQDRKYKVKDSFLNLIPDESREYNEAVKLFNDYLEERAEMLRRLEKDGEDIYAIAKSYCLTDLSSDGIPELVTRYNDAFAGVEIHMIIDGKLQEVDFVGGYGGDGGVTVTESGYIMGHMSKTDREWYDFYSYTNTGDVNEFHFGRYSDYFRDGIDYRVNGKSVSKEKYIQLTGEYIDISKNVVRMENMVEEIKQ